MSSTKEYTLKVGPETQQGTVRVSAQHPRMLTLSVSYKGERAATVVLTPAQVRELRQALAELEAQVGAAPTTIEAGPERLLLAA